MKKRRIFYILAAVIILSLSVLSVSAIADAGFFSGDSDYGGSDWGSSDWDSDWGSSDDDYYYSGDGAGGGTVFAVIIVAIFIAAFVIIKSKKKVRGTGGASYTPSAQTAPLRPLSELLGKDPNFSEAAMREKISNLYVRMQSAWQAKDFEPMRPFMTDALYNQFSRQLDELKRSGRTNYVERIAVLGVTLDGWAEDETSDAITATVNTRIVDYTLDDSTGNVVSGSKTAEKFLTYQWTLIRSRGMLTPQLKGEGRDGVVEISCPSCGAPVEINQSAKCDYCGSIINAKDYDWSISSIRGISQRTAGK